MANDLAKIDNELRKYGISSPLMRSIRVLEAALTNVLGESPKTYMVGLELRIELQKLGYRIAKIPKPRSS